jgi:glucuronate isomerase
MREFLGEDFFLTNRTAQVLYHDAAKDMPIFDFHCHLVPREIYDNRAPEDLGELWFAADHYKWRLMRAAGVPESYITGDAPPYDKFLAWAEVLPRAAGNPLYHWTHLELRRYFDIKEPLNRDTAPKIWEWANRQIQIGDFRPRTLLERMKVRRICTTDDAAEGLEAQRLLAADKTLSIDIRPTFRLDPLFRICQPSFMFYTDALGEGRGRPADFDALRETLSRKMDDYAVLGCVTADHGLARVPFNRVGKAGAERIYKKRITGKELSAEEEEGFQTELLLWLFTEYQHRGWVAQLHLGSLSDGNTRLTRAIHSAIGVDSMRDEPLTFNLNCLFDTLNDKDALPRTVLFHLDPAKLYPLATLGGNFSGPGHPGKVQIGPPWWLIDHRDGIRYQIETFANCSILGLSVGMLTDSRSFLSYPRHEYYRRILCDTLGRWVEAGEYPGDMPGLMNMVKDICYNNAVNFFTGAAV